PGKTTGHREFAAAQRYRRERMASGLLWRLPTPAGRRSRFSGGDNTSRPGEGRRAWSSRRQSGCAASWNTPTGSSHGASSARRRRASPSPTARSTIWLEPASWCAGTRTTTTSCTTRCSSAHRSCRSPIPAPRRRIVADTEQHPPLLGGATDGDVPAAVVFPPGGSRLAFEAEAKSSSPLAAAFLLGLTVPERHALRIADVILSGRGASP